jgi:hypothetical protein
LNALSNKLEWIERLDITSERQTAVVNAENAKATSTAAPTQREEDDDFARECSL